jgi:hypothetical protein
MMCAACVHIQRVEALTGGDEEAVSFGAAEAEVAGGFGQLDEADELALGIEDVDAIVAITDPASACPNIALNVFLSPCPCYCLSSRQSHHKCGRRRFEYSQRLDNVSMWPRYRGLL